MIATVDAFSRLFAIPDFLKPLAARHRATEFHSPSSAARAGDPIHKFWGVPGLILHGQRWPGGRTKVGEDIGKMKCHATPSPDVLCNGEGSPWRPSRPPETSNTTLPLSDWPTNYEGVVLNYERASKPTDGTARRTTKARPVFVTGRAFCLRGQFGPIQNRSPRASRTALPTARMRGHMV